MDEKPERSEEEILADLLTGQQSESEFVERRRFSRRDIRVPIEFIPLSPGGVSQGAAIAGETRNISSAGIAIVLSEPPLAPRWSVRLNLGSKAVALEVSVRHIQRMDEGGFFLSCQFVRRLDDAT